MDEWAGKGAEWTDEKQPVNRNLRHLRDEAAALLKGTSPPAPSLKPAPTGKRGHPSPAVPEDNQHDGTGKNSYQRRGARPARPDW